MRFLEDAATQKCDLRLQWSRQAASRLNLIAILTGRSTCCSRCFAQLVALCNLPAQRAHFSRQCLGFLGSSSNGLSVAFRPQVFTTTTVRQNEEIPRSGCPYAPHRPAVPNVQYRTYTISCIEPKNRITTMLPLSVRDSMAMQCASLGSCCPTLTRKLYACMHALHQALPSA